MKIRRTIKVILQIEERLIIRFAGSQNQRRNDDQKENHDDVRRAGGLLARFWNYGARLQRTKMDKP